MLPPTPTQYYLVLIDSDVKFPVMSFTISKRLKKYYTCNHNSDRHRAIPYSLCPPKHIIQVENGNQRLDNE